MKRLLSNNPRILAIDPYDRGYGFVVMEQPNELVDWGMKGSQNRPPRFLILLGTLLDRYEPDILVTEDAAEIGSSRRRETRILLNRIYRSGYMTRLPVYMYSRAEVKDTFSLVGASTKHQIATAIANWFPELGPRLPQPQKPWTGENRSMNVFDAASFALTFYHFEKLYTLARRPSLQPSLSACAGGMSPGHGQAEEDTDHLSSLAAAAPTFRPDRLPPQRF